MLKYVLIASMVGAAQGQDCTTLTHSDNACNLGQRLVDLDTLTTCKDYICSNLMGIYSIAHGASQTKKLTGQSYGCEIEDWDGTNVGEVICMPGNPPPPPAPTPAPVQSCDSLVFSRGTCPPGGSIVDLDTLAGCKDFLCQNRMGPFDYAHGTSMTHLLAGEAYGCDLKVWNGEGQDGIICSLELPFDCAVLEMKNTTGGCSAGMAPVGVKTVIKCSEYLCDNILGPYDLAHGEDVHQVLTGSADGCTMKTTAGAFGYTICGPQQ